MTTTTGERGSAGVRERNNGRERREDLASDFLGKRKEASGFVSAKPLVVHGCGGWI
jgi:hypothetical protein